LALLNGGELEGKRILQPETLKSMWAPQFHASDALPPICMGFYQVWRNGLRFIGHGGDLLAFHSMFFLEPQRRLVLFVSYNSAGSANKNRDEIIRIFADHYYPSTDKPAYLNLSPADAQEYAGTYLPTRRADSNISALANLFQQGVVSVDKDGALSVNVLKDSHGHVAKWKPIAKDLWQQVDEQNKLFFVRDSSGKIVRVAFDYPAIQVQRVPWWENAKFILTMLGISVGVLLLPILATVIRFVRRLLFRRRSPFQPQPDTLYLTTGPRLACLAWLIVAGIAGSVAAYFASDTASGPTYAFDKYLVILNLFTAIAIFLSLWALLSGIFIWRRDLRWITKVKFSLIALACVFLFFFSLHYHVLGPAHRY